MSESEESEFYLVLWTNCNPPTTSILHKEKIKIKNNVAKGKWGNNWCNCKIMTKDRKFLNRVYNFLCIFYYYILHIILKKIIFSYNH